MSTYDDASLIMFPSGYKAGKAYSLKPTDGSGDLTFTRASTATRVNEQGLIEGVRTNLLLQSNTFDTTWTSVNTTETGGQAGYDGTNNAWLLEKSAAGARIVQSISLIGLQTTSLYAKAGTLNWLAFTGNGSSSAYFDLQNGVVGTVSAGATAQMVSVGGGWYRCSLSQSVTLTGVRIYAADGDLDTSGTSGSIYIQDAQLEASVQATEYIPTTTTAVSVGMLANVPRIDYTGGGCGKLLLEPQRTNLIQYSEDFSQGYWTKSGSSVVSGFVSPKGDLSAFKMVESATTGSHIIISPTIIKAASSLDYSFSLFAKKGERDFLAYRIDAGASNGCYVCFNLSNGTISTSATLSGTGFTNASAKITLLGSGFYKCSISFNTNTQTIIRVIKSVQQTTGNPFTYSSTGDGTSGIYIYGASLEQGSYPTSYIPTSGTAVTRVADSASKSGISSLIGQTEGVLFCEVRISDINSSGFGITLNDGTFNNRVYIGKASSSPLIYAIISVGGNIITIIGGNYSAADFVKIAVSYKSGETKVFFNGSQLGATSATAFTLPTLTKLSFDAGGVAPFYGECQNLMIFQTALTDTELETLTTI